MLGQIDIFGKTKLETTLERIKMFEPEDGYYVAFSGGKDSQCIYHLCEMAGVKFDAHYSVTSVDPPELVQFIKKHYPDVIFDHSVDKDGKWYTMWNLIVQHGMPPTRIARYCCQKLKESSGEGRITMTGVRWAESANRKNNQGKVTIIDGKRKKTKKTLENLGVNFTSTDKGGVVLNDDNDESRRAVEICYRTRKTLVNPIIDWDESDVWEFLNEVVKVPHCCLYDEGFKRLGCIGCPMGTTEKRTREFERYPTYKRAYIRAFDKMIDEKFRGGQREQGRIARQESNSSKSGSRYRFSPESTGEEIFKWWIQEDIDGKQPNLPEM